MSLVPDNTSILGIWHSYRFCSILKTILTLLLFHSPKYEIFHCVCILRAQWTYNYWDIWCLNYYVFLLTLLSHSCIVYNFKYRSYNPPPLFNSVLFTGFLEAFTNLLITDFRNKLWILYLVTGSRPNIFPDGKVNFPTATNIVLRSALVDGTTLVSHHFYLFMNRAGTAFRLPPTLPKDWGGQVVGRGHHYGSWPKLTKGIFHSMWCHNQQ